MAKNTQVKEDRKSKKRKGIHAKTQSSKLKNSKNYLKRYRGQGR
jgi:t-SNARE complex subunit (syntaxin)